MIKLDKTTAKKIKHVMWVAIGVGNEIPYYENYISLLARPLDEGTFALFYLFKKPETGNKN